MIIMIDICINLNSIIIILNILQSILIKSKLFRNCFRVILFTVLKYLQITERTGQSQKV